MSICQTCGRTLGCLGIEKKNSELFSQNIQSSKLGEVELWLMNLINESMVRNSDTFSRVKKIWQYQSIEINNETII